MGRTGERGGAVAPGARAWCVWECPLLFRGNNSTYAYTHTPMERSALPLRLVCVCVHVVWQESTRVCCCRLCVYKVKKVVPCVCG